MVIAAGSSSRQGFHRAGMTLVVPRVFLGGAIYRRRGMPDWLAALMRVASVNHQVDAMRHLTSASAGSWTTVGGMTSKPCQLAPRPDRAPRLQPVPAMAAIAPASNQEPGTGLLGKGQANWATGNFPAISRHPSRRGSRFRRR